jgi:hypothetical protein
MVREEAFNTGDRFGHLSRQCSTCRLLFYAVYSKRDLSLSDLSNAFPCRRRIINHTVKQKSESEGHKLSLLVGEESSFDFILFATI